MKKFSLLLLLFCLVANGNKLDGYLIYEFGDSFSPSKQYTQRYYLQTDQVKIPLSLSDAFEKRMPIRAWSGKKVAITFKSDLFLDGRENAIQAIELLEGETRGSAVTGPQPWVSILCKFSDIAAEPEDQSFFQNMYANQVAGVDHYWREVSYGAINVVGSQAVDWVDLPSTQTTYIPTPGSNDDSNLGLLFSDCTDAADPFINYATGANGSSFVGINMMFNDLLDCCAWGGGRFANLDGLSKFWRVTWNPPWSFANEGVIAHEMGHGFGLPHANNSDEDSNPYDSPWDVMSDAHGYAVTDNIYGRLGKHINMEFKHNLGWVDDSDGYIASPTSDDLFLIVYSSKLVTTGHRFAKIPLSDGSHYMVEVRKQEGNYENNLPGTAVIIHHVVSNRSQPPWLVDEDVPPANYSDNEGVMWKTGETFIDPIDGYQVEVRGLFTNGYNVKITAQNDIIFIDGFD